MYINFEANQNNFSISLLSHRLLTDKTSTYLQSMFTTKVTKTPSEARNGNLMLHIVDDMRNHCENETVRAIRTYERCLFVFEVDGLATVVKARHVRGKTVVESEEKHDRFGEKLS